MPRFKVSFTHGPDKKKVFRVMELSTDNQKLAEKLALLKIHKEKYKHINLSYVNKFQTEDDSPARWVKNRAQAKTNF